MKYKATFWNTQLYWNSTTLLEVEEDDKVHLLCTYYYQTAVSSELEISARYVAFSIIQPLNHKCVDNYLALFLREDTANSGYATQIN